MSSEIPVFQSIARALKDHDVKTLFGLMGDANLFMVDHYVKELSGKFVSAAHEASCVLMAMGYAHVSGKVGVATVTHGPALTNCITALVEGTRGRSPIVLLAGDTPVGNPRHPQNLDQRELVKTTGAGFEQMRSPETVAEDVARAFYRAHSEQRPVVLNMPVDLMWQTTTHTVHVRDVFSETRGVAQSKSLDDAVGIVASARRPLVLAGGGAMAAKTQIVELADRLQAPLATTLKGKDLFRDHPYNIGILGTLSSPAAYEVVGLADCIISFGSSLSDYTTGHGGLIKDKRIVQIDVEPTALGVGSHPDAGIVADAGHAAQQILYWLDEAEIAPSGFTAELEPETLTHYPLTASKAKPGYLDYAHTLERLDKALPNDRVLVTDVGRFMLEAWCRISVPDPRSFLPTTNFTSIGLGLQEAIGAAFASPERTVVLFCGDGGFMMGAINEFHTAVSNGLDCIVIVANDSAYGAEHIQFTNRQMDPSQSVLDWPGFAEVANALGGEGYKADSEEALEAALLAMENRKGPFLIELCLDPGDMPTPRV
ncbi:MAG: thiamine pyrophosphate-binding protein [Pseudomonadota bacterium]